MRKADRPDCSDVERLIALRDETGGFIAEAWMPAHHPQWVLAREIVARGDLGRLHTVTGVFHLRAERSGECAQQRRACGRGDAGYRRLPCGSLPFRHRARASRDPCGGRVGKWRGRLHLGRRPRRRRTVPVPRFHAPRPSGRKWCSRGDGGWLSVRAPFNAGEYGQADMIRAAVRRIRQGVPFSDPARQYVNQVEAVAATLLDGAAYPMPLRDLSGYAKGAPTPCSPASARRFSNGTHQRANWRLPGTGSRS